MRKGISLLLALMMIIMNCAGCGKKQNLEPETSQMKAICELATLECYYRNVAKYKKEDVEGILWWEKDRQFWVEYEGVVTLGIDATLVDIEVNDTKVKITLPPAEVQGCKVETLTEDSFIVAKKSADIDASIQTKVFKDAQANMKKSAAADKTLLNTAQQRAKTLLEDYIENIGDITGKEYTIEWVYVDKNGEVIK